MVDAHSRSAPTDASKVTTELRTALLQLQQAPIRFPRHLFEYLPLPRRTGGQLLRAQLPALIQDRLQQPLPRRDLRQLLSETIRLSMQRQRLLVGLLRLREMHTVLP